MSVILSGATCYVYTHNMTIAYRSLLILCLWQVTCIKRMSGNNAGAIYFKFTKNKEDGTTINYDSFCNAAAAGFSMHLLIHIPVG